MVLSDEDRQKDLQSTWGGDGTWPSRTELGLEEWPGCEVCASLDLQQ